MNIEEQYFTCKKCGESKIWGEFQKDRTCKDGILKSCYKCQYLTYGKKAADMTPEQIEKKREYDRKYRQNSTSLKARKKQYCQKNAGSISKKQKEWRLLNIDKVRERERQRSRDNYGTKKQYYAEWKLRNKDKISANSKKYQINNKDKTRARLNAYGEYIRKEIAPQYAKQILRRKGFTIEQIAQNPELINIQRIIIQTKRLCKT